MSIEASEYFFLNLGVTAPSLILANIAKINEGKILFSDCLALKEKNGKDLSLLHSIIII